MGQWSISATGYRVISNARVSFIKRFASVRISFIKRSAEGSNLRIYGSSGGLFEGGGLLTINSSVVGAYLRGGGGFFDGGGAIQGFTVLRCGRCNFLPISRKG